MFKRIRQNDFKIFFLILAYYLLQLLDLLELNPKEGEWVGRDERHG